MKQWRYQDQSLEEEEKHGGKYCVAGGPGGISCTNRQYTEGVSIHNFPDPKKA